MIRRLSDGGMGIGGLGELGALGILGIGGSWDWVISGCRMYILGD